MPPRNVQNVSGFLGTRLGCCKIASFGGDAPTEPDIMLSLSGKKYTRQRRASADYFIRQEF